MNGNDENTPLEIERKFLIRMPDPARLARESVRRIDITQLYLKTDDVYDSRRLRGKGKHGASKGKIFHKLCALAEVKKA